MACSLQNKTLHRVFTQDVDFLLFFSDSTYHDLILTVYVYSQHVYLLWAELTTLHPSLYLTHIYCWAMLATLRPNFCSIGQ